MGEFVGNTSQTIQSLAGPPISVISNVDNIRRRLQRAMKETGLLNSQELDRVVEESLDKEGEEMVADDAKTGNTPVRLVNQAQTAEQNNIEQMKVFEVVDRQEASGSKVVRTRCVVTNEGTFSFSGVPSFVTTHLVLTTLLRRLGGTRITLWQSLTSGVHTSVQRLSRRRSSNCPDKMLRKTDALLVRDETGCKAVAT